MKIINSILTRFFGPTFISQALRSVSKYITGYLLLIGVSQSKATTFVDLLVDISGYMITGAVLEGWSFLVTKKALETPIDKGLVPLQPKIAKE